ncbi:endonuclease MutS2 [Prochlorococcus marinus]|uniref:endonuclease MutS2 n=1 Tax=Prochlorococcus marinus TaxID=1219 RepID=UPI000533AAAB|nr:endonuclease MutS2 [Prochlorococcus marinus]KGG11437.1 Recombination inhibitory protein MutS2 [Prochlorococcus marinus str. LG]
MSYQYSDSESCVADIACDETLDLLEWPRLCEQLASFASTSQGQKKCKTCSIPDDIKTTRRYLSETIEIGSIDEEIEGGISFLGVNYLDQILLRSSKGGVLSGLELLSVAETLKAARRLRRQIYDPLSRPIISSLLSDLATLPELQRLIEFGLEEGGRVADRASEKLSELRRQVYILRIERRDLLKDLIRKCNSFLQDTVIAERYNRPVLALKSGAIDQLLGTIHDNSASGNTVFLEPKAVIPLGNRIEEFEAKILVEEQRLLAYWSEEVGTNFQVLESLSQILLRLEFALARARYSNWLGGVAPQIRDEEDAPFIIQEFRHPLLIWQEHYEQGDVVIPISFEVSSDLRVVAITGPNTGGKTVTLKSIGLAILMTKLGLFLPCVGEPSLPWCNQVLADIGDEQSLQQNLSTFSGHVVRIIRIFDAIAIRSGPSIILLDELGAGTDPTEGTALAIALLKTFADRARLTIATTHFGELKALKYHDSRFENASVGFDSETIRPTYHLQWGIPGKSNALAIARRLGLDHLVANRAQDLIGSNGVDNVNQVIQGLEEQRQRQQDAAEEAAALLARTEMLHDELMSRWHKQCQQSEDFQERGRKELEISIREGQVEVRELIRRLRDRSADGEIARKTGQRLRRIENIHRQQKSFKNERAWSPKAGDRVRLISIGKAGEVISVSADGRQLTVMCGLFRSIVDLHAVESLDGQKPNLPDSVVNIKTTTPLSNSANIRTKRNTVDVRGLRVHEAESVIEEKLRNMVGPLWVVHGIGTGRLKKGLTEWLDNLDYVEKITTAEQVDGGAGCSIIWLK